MSVSYAMNAGTSFDPEPSEPVMDSIFQQYERVLVESLISSFGLDFLIKDQHGGDVDTIHNVRQIGKDEQMTYKNAKNEKDYEQRGDYNSSMYHNDPRFKAKKRENRAKREAGELFDAYTNKKISPDGNSDIDHVVSAKEIHDDRGRVLAGLSGTDLANCEENLQATNPHTNRTKKADSMEKFLDKYGDEYTQEQKSNMRQKDAAARKAYEAKLAKNYYTSPKFAKDLSLAAGNVGVRMGIRQALGVVFAEMWFAVKEEFQAVQKQNKFAFGDFLTALGHGIKRGFERAKQKYNELFAKFLSGATAGALSSLTTTLCNIFFTTAKNAVRIIRESYASIVEAGKVLFINPDNYTFGKRMQAVIKILATGASTVVGVLVKEAIEKTPIGAIPIARDVIPTFCGAFVTGIMSCTLLYFIDRSELAQKLFSILDSLPFVEKEIAYYRQQAEYFERYAAEMMNIDIAQFKKETKMYGDIARKLESVMTDEELNLILLKTQQEAGIRSPWEGHDKFQDFMDDADACLVFQ